MKQKMNKLLFCHENVLYYNYIWDITLDVICKITKWNNNLNGICKRLIIEIVINNKVEVKI